MSPQPTHSAPNLVPYVVAGGAAGNITVTGISVKDRLAAVIDLGSAATLPTGPLGPANFEISTNFDIQNGDAFDMLVAGVPVTVATDKVFDTGTAATTAIDTWIAAILSIDEDGTTTHVDWGTGGHASEALAIAALAVVVASGDVTLGYVTILTDSGATWTAGTDALQGGTGGGPSDDTNYYNDGGVGAQSGASGNLTSEFTITAANTINNAGGTSSAGGMLLILAWTHDTRGQGFNRT